MTSESQSDLDMSELALRYQRSGCFPEAEAVYREILACGPASPEIHTQLGNTLRHLGRLEEAEAACRQALMLSPDYAGGHYNLGRVFMDLGKIEEAEKAFRKALMLQIDFAEAYNNRGLSLLALGRISAAENCFRQAISLQPFYAEPLTNLGRLLRETERFEESELCCRKAEYLMAGEAKNKLVLSLSYLLHGQLEEGFKLYEERFEAGSASALSGTCAQFAELLGLRRWKGEPLEGKSLLIVTEQGYGDSIMMMRYLSVLREQGVEHLLVYCVPLLKRLFESVPAAVEVVPMTDPLPLARIDWYCPIMSLPYFLKTKVSTIPASVPYVFAPDELKTDWRARLGGFDGIKVGVCWAGNPLHPANDARSIRLSTFTPLKEIGGVHFFSLQKGPEAAQTAEIDWDIAQADFIDFTDAAAMISELDLVISVDTSIAHLAGALGKPVWLLNRFESEWRWMLDREDSPWYPTMRIFRQKERGDWDSVIKRVAEELADLTAKGYPPRIL